ncbi:proteasome regulatory particle base subunit [Coemansia sp. RSA 989]|nr:Dolichyl-diphosphooligosaccharide--protein glycosyltransferase subunit Swp1 [Coemansia mojavensis]KAJ1748206.1 proteasome regulatory particle base subunit [Coemansia sp. RSA 1821]KAJ1866167.1 proteasome regulatory particle base subunit [Coemansia sp. RSA 989]KAJ2671326.1 proteasome regulatory particle base subunit [Coemansia sp. RSA 1085]
MRLLGFNQALAGICAVVGIFSVSAYATVETKNVVVRVMERTGDKLFEEKLRYPASFDAVPKVKALTPLVISFDVLSNDTALPLDQAFVSFQHTETKAEVALPAQNTKNSGSYKLDVSRKVFRQNFGSVPGVYNVALVLGSFAEGGLFYELGNVHMVAGNKAKLKEPKATYGPKPEIQHRFAEPQKMPNILFSLLFTGLAVAPLVALLGVWGRLGVNLQKLQLEPVGSVAFMGLVAAYMALAVAYWVGLKLFPTLGCALVLSLPTYLTGQYALSKRIVQNI